MLGIQMIGRVIQGLYRILPLLLFSAIVHAEPSKLHFAGMAFMGQFAGKDTLYPYTARLMLDDEVKIQKALRQRISNVKNNSFEIVLDTPMDLKKESALTLALALEYENIGFEQIDNNFKIDIDLRANILIFDFQELMVVASYPVSVELRDLSDHKPSGQELLDKVRSIYLNDGEINIFNEFVKRLNSLNFKPHFNNTIKVRNVTIEDEALPILPQRGDDKAKTSYEVLLAQTFSSYLTKNQNVSVLPYTKGHAIGNKMALQVANGDVYNLKIPDETYAIDITLRKFSKANMGSNKYKSVWGYASYFGIKVFIPGEDDSLLDAKFRGMVTKSILKDSSHAVYDWAIYSESMNKLFDELTLHISQPDEDWLKKVTVTKNIVAQLDKFNEIIKSCQ